MKKRIFPELLKKFFPRIYEWNLFRDLNKHRQELVEQRDRFKEELDTVEGNLKDCKEHLTPSDMTDGYILTHLSMLRDAKNYLRHVVDNYDYAIKRHDETVAKMKEAIK